MSGQRRLSRSPPPQLSLPSRSVQPPNTSTKNSKNLQVKQSSLFVSIKSFKPGALLIWDGDQIKGCRNLDFNVNANKILYKIKSKSKNKFCPEYLQIWFNNTYFRSDKMSFWLNKFGRSFSKNVALFAARKVPIQVYKKIRWGKFYRFLEDSFLVYPDS